MSDNIEEAVKATRRNIIERRWGIVPSLSLPLPLPPSTPVHLPTLSTVLIRPGHPTCQTPTPIHSILVLSFLSIKSKLDQGHLPSLPPSESTGGLAGHSSTLSRPLIPAFDAR